MAIYEQRRSVFLPPESVTRTRYTCRDEQGHARLMPRVDLMDAIEHLCRLEEDKYGVIVKGMEGKQMNGSDGGTKRWEDERRTKA